MINFIICEIAKREYWGMDNTLTRHIVIGFYDFVIAIAYQRVVAGVLYS